MRRRNLTATVSAAALLACALGCTGAEPADAPHDGPLRFGGEAGTLCLTAGSATDFTLAFDAARNSTESDISVDQVRLVDAHNATLVAGYLAPIIDLTLIGVMRGWPPQEGSLRAFEQKKPVPRLWPRGQTPTSSCISGLIPSEHRGHRTDLHEPSKAPARPQQHELHDP